MHTIPATIKAAKAIVLRGTSYAKDATISAADIAALRKLDALISKNVLYATPDVFGRNTSSSGGVRKGKRRPTPVFIGAKSRVILARGTTNDFTVSAVVDGTLTKKVTITLVGGEAPFSINWGDSSSSSVRGRTATRTYATASTFTITVTSSNFDTTSTTATTT